LQIHYHKRQTTPQQLDYQIQNFLQQLSYQLQQLSTQQSNMNNEHYQQYFQQLTYQTQHLSLQSQLLQLSYSPQVQKDAALITQYQTQYAYQAQQIQLQHQLELLPYQRMQDEDRKRYQSELESQFKQIQYYLHQLQQSSTAAVETQELFDPRSTENNNPNSIQISVSGDNQSQAEANYEDNSAAGVRQSQVDLNGFNQPIGSPPVEASSNQS